MPSAQNQLIALLPARAGKHLLSRCETVSLQIGEILCTPGEKTRYVYFPIDSTIALVTEVDGRPGVEVGMVGREGVLGVQLALGIAVTPQQAIVQGSGRAWRMEAASLIAELKRSPALQRLLYRYIFVLMTQLATSAACLRYHPVGPRLARWMLMTQDRAGADSFQLTHATLAMMLGVRRVGITAAAGQLQRDGLIRYRRGAVTVLDIPGLLAASCSCYATDRLTYRNAMG